MSDSILAVSPTSAQIQRSFLKTSSVGFLRTLLAVPIYLGLTPFILQAIGKEMFGLWSINTIVTTALLVVDFGFQSSLVHFTALNQDDHPKLAELFNTVFLILSASSAFCFLAIAGFRGVILHELLGISMDLHSEGTFVLIATAAGFCLRLVFMPHQALIEGHQRTDYSQRVFLTWMVFNALGTVIGLRISPTVYSLGIVSILGSMLIALMFFRDAHRRYPFARINPRLCRIATIRAILPYVVGMQMAGVFVLVREPILKTVVTRKFGLSDLASFEIAYRLTVQCMSFAAVPLLTALPAASLLSHRTLDIRKMVRKYLAWVIVILAIPAAVVYPASGPALRLWLGAGYDDAAALLPWIFGAHALCYLTEPIFKILQGVGLSVASAVIQGLFLAVLGFGLLLWTDGGDLLSIANPLIAAATVFCLSNLLVYSRYLRRERT
ncbi:MAG: lipopolysaccharide biosynthesis protein [Syntrophobacteraceae bacterium]